MGRNDSFQIGEQIKYYRKLKKLSQENLALSAGVNPAFVGYIERGIKSPTVTTLQKIANALDISLAELFSPLPNKDFLADKRNKDMEYIMKLLEDMPDEDISSIIQILINIIEIKRRQT